VLPRYGIYESKCKILSEQIISNDTATVSKDCSGQIDKYQVRLNINKNFERLFVNFSLLLLWVLDSLIYQLC
jgi:hypothetical protein